MTFKLKAWFLAPAFFVATAGMAMAEEDLPPCPENPETHIGSVRGYFEQKDGPVNEAAINDANLLEVVCADQFITMYQLADTWYQLLLRTGFTLEQQGTIANRAFGILVQADAAPFVAHDYQLAGDVRTRIVDAAVQYADAGGPPGPFLTEGGTFGSCENHWGTITQSLWYAYRDEWTGTARPALIANASQSCTNEPRRYVHRWFGALRAEQARRESDPVKALALMEEARAAYLLYTGADDEAAGWGLDEDETVVAEYGVMKFLASYSQPRLPREDWFKPENIENGAARIAIAQQANDLWGPHYSLSGDVATKDEFAAQVRGYSEFVRAAKSEADAAGPEAQLTLYEALRDHAGGTLRTPETKDYKFPVQSLYSWTEPSQEE